MRVLIADDEPLARERLTLLVKSAQPDAEIVEATNGTDTLALLSAGTSDVVFLDVQMPMLDESEVLQTLDPAQRPTTVFVTAFDTYALRALEVSAVDYLLKPFDDEGFRATWKRVGERRAMKAVQETKRFTDRVLIKHEGRSVTVRLADVQWIESAGNYVLLHVGCEKHQLRETLTNLESRLDPGLFVRIHRRVIVAVDSMRELQAWLGGDQIMILKDGMRLRVSRNFRQHVAGRLSGVV